MLYMKSFCIFLHKRRIQYNKVFVHVHSSITFNSLTQNSKGEYQSMVTRKRCMKKFPKTKMFYSMIRTRKCACQGVRNVSFWKIL